MASFILINNLKIVMIKMANIVDKKSKINVKGSLYNCLEKGGQSYWSMCMGQCGKSFFNTNVYHFFNLPCFHISFRDHWLDDGIISVHNLGLTCCTFPSKKMSDMLHISRFMIQAVQLLLHCVHSRHLQSLIQDLGAS